MSGFRIWSLHQGFLPKGRLRWIELRDAQRFQYRGGLLAASGHAQLAACIQLQFHPAHRFRCLPSPGRRKRAPRLAQFFSRARSCKKASAPQTCETGPFRATMINRPDLQQALQVSEAPLIVSLHFSKNRRALLCFQAVTDSEAEKTVTRPLTSRKICHRGGFRDEHPRFSNRRG